MHLVNDKEDLVIIQKVLCLLKNKQAATSPEQIDSLACLQMLVELRNFYSPLCNWYAENEN